MYIKVMEEIVKAIQMRDPTTELHIKLNSFQSQIFVVKQKIADFLKIQSLYLLFLGNIDISSLLVHQCLYNKA